MHLQLDTAALRPLIAEVVKEVLTGGNIPPDLIAVPERQAAALMGLPRHVLRDARLRGEIHGKLVGKKIVYKRAELERFLSPES